MTDTLDNRSIAVVRTRLPYTDRRSLSQAWFSALHLAESGPARGMPARRASDGPALVPRDGQTHSSPAVSERLRTMAFTPRVRPPALDRPIDGGPRSAPRVRVASLEKIGAATFERARSYPPFKTSLTVGVDGARIKLLLRRDGPTLHVIALCAPANVDLVRRALACADAHLRRNGESVRASVVST